ncbi:MAG: MOSC domain-containing protein [Methylobacterium sp.]|nr:MOSC domain-containing protein [Methylobacterium sp.]MCA3602869.1 MOSC domain-containing protein [Methylobacterium sp.]MCA3614767.1 MOSC domain-containing protein [Methylobacterium sp.]MCA4910880.1 MOSC domain-containing protein [Methylobacterium sp.]
MSEITQSRLGARQDSNARLAALYRYPVKGLSPEAISEAHLTEGAHFPADRLMAIENGPSGFDPAAPEHLPKQKFLMLMRNEKLARIAARFEDATQRLTLRQGGAVVASGMVDDRAGRAAIERFFESYMGEEMRGPARLLMAPPGHRFMDSPHGFLSIINRASVEAIAKLANRASIDPLRFRGNLLVEGLAPWAEFDLVGQRVKIGEAELEITRRIDRCAATDVDPRAGIRDLRMVALLEQNLAHHECGVYARILRSGTIRPGNALTVL